MKVGTTELVLGPLLRYAGTESATFWVETSGSCEFEVLGHCTSTFAIGGHHGVDALWTYASRCSEAGSNGQTPSCLAPPFV